MKDRKYKIVLEEVITYQNFFDALKTCNKNVSYKYSVQEYNANCIQYITDTINYILSGGVPNVRDCPKITIYERGKKRTITPIDIWDRITQKVLCDNVLAPSIYPHLIYDNGACIKGKGAGFSRKRANRFIEAAKREYGSESVYVLLFDFQKFFDSIPHMQCYNILKKYIYDDRLVDLTIKMLESYQLHDLLKIEDPAVREREIASLYNHEKVGICLGSQISQIMAVAVPNDFDHFIKDVLGIKYYVRHMDDGIIILDSEEKLCKYKKILGDYANSIGLRFNSKKTRIVNASKGFTFLKVKYNITQSKKTIKRLPRQGTVRERRKLSKFENFVKSGNMTTNDVYNSVQSWTSHAKIAKSFHAVKSMLYIYDKKFGGYKITRKYYREHPDEKRKRKVVRV